MTKDDDDGFGCLGAILAIIVLIIMLCIAIPASQRYQKLRRDAIEKLNKGEKLNEEEIDAIANDMVGG